jgi:hypothetical protein
LTIGENAREKLTMTDITWRREKLTMSDITWRREKLTMTS